MEHVVIGLNDELPGQTVIDWIIDRAKSHPVQIRLVAELDTHASNPDAVKDLLAGAAHRISDAVPGTQVEMVVAELPLLHELVEESESADLIVVGAHPDPSIREPRKPSLPVRLAARSHCPVVIVPDDWKAGSGPVVVGIAAATAAHEEAAFAAHEAEDSATELEIVHTWEPWNAPMARQEKFEHEVILNEIVESIRTEFPAVRVHGVLREAAAHLGILASSRGAHLIVLGTHGLGRGTGVILGVIHQEVMIRGGVALCVVPLGPPPDAE
ncbi:MAG: universal stress protein [Pseudolysinimonas sp.]